MTHLRWVPLRSRGAATYVRSTPRATQRAAPCIWAFLSILGKTSFQHLLKKYHSPSESRGPVGALPAGPFRLTRRKASPIVPLAAGAEGSETMLRESEQLAHVVTGDRTAEGGLASSAARDAVLAFPAGGGA